MPLVLTRSDALRRRAEKLFPGGVNSPVRAFRAVGGAPPFVERGEGAYLWDADGNRFIDYFGSWGPMILGHAFPAVVEAIQRAAAHSASFGASTRAEGDLAELVAPRSPPSKRCASSVPARKPPCRRFGCARAFTGRKFIVKFEGCYHGHADGLLVKAGSGVATFGIPGSAGVPEEVAHFTLALPYNDVVTVEAAFAAHPSEIAAVIVEPIVGNAGCIPPAPGYLEGLRTLTEKHGALLIFDEVMTGFRVAFGGAQELYGIRPDLTTLGKIVGGGLPVGVFGGKPASWTSSRPLGRFTRRARSAVIRWPWPPASPPWAIWAPTRKNVYPKLERLSAAVADGVAAAATRQGIPLTTNRVGAMFTWFFRSEPVTNYEQAARSDTNRFAAFHRAMLQAGVWLPPSQFEAAFLSTAHTEADIRHTVDAARRAFAAIARD